MKIYKYSDIRDTKIPWFRYVPNHWKIERLKWTIEYCKNGIWGEEATNEDDIVCIRVADFDRTKLLISTKNLTLRNIKESDLGQRILETGDLLIEKSGGGEKQLVGAVVQFNIGIRAVSSNFIAKMPPQKYFDSRFLTYLHYHLYFSKVNYRSIKQTTGIQNLDTTQYLDELVALPTYDEQKAIADFLDYKTAQIDELIEEKEKLLELLEEKRVALITRAVTKGLNPYVKMKPSGIDWLGDIPEHWEIKKLKYISKIQFSGVDKKSLETEIEIKLCNYVDVYKNEFIDRNIDFMIATATEKEINKFLIEEGDTIVTKDSETPEDIAVPALVIDKFKDVICGYHLAQIKPKKNILIPEYLFRLFQAKNFNSYFTKSANGITRFGLGTDVFGSVYIPITNLKEQTEITNYIKINCDKIKNLKENIIFAIEKLKEYRSALITSAVTGKIDVRNFKPENKGEII